MNFPWQRLCFVSVMLLLCATVQAQNSPPPVIPAESIATLLAARQAALATCMAHLPARESIAWQDSRGHGAFPKSCVAAKRLRDDAKDMLRLRDHLLDMAQQAHVPAEQAAVAQREAEDIAKRLVMATREHALLYPMAGSSLLNNMLVNIGAKDQGLCYQWVRQLLAGLPAQPYIIFERSWGGAYLQRVLENNSVIITVRDQPFATGLMFDAWRGGGNAYWKWVKKDHYPWTVRFTETEILTGQATVMGTMEEKKQKAN